MTADERRSLVGLILAAYHGDGTALGPLSDLIEETGESFHDSLTAAELVRRIRTGRFGWKTNPKPGLVHMLHNVLGEPWAEAAHPLNNTCPACQLLCTTNPVVQTPSAHV